MEKYLKQRQLPLPIVPTISNSAKQFNLEKKIYHKIDTNVLNRYKVQPPTYQNPIINKSIPKDTLKGTYIPFVQPESKNVNDSENGSKSSLLIPIIISLLIL